MSEHVCGTIQYMNEAGQVHSDICFDGKPTTEQRAFLHASLDEWLDEQSGGDGEAFLLGDHRAFHPDQWDIDHAASMILRNIKDCGPDFSKPTRAGIEFYVKDGIKRLLS